MAVEPRSALKTPENTPRLALSPLTPDDAPFMLAVWNDPAFLRFVGDRGVRTLDDARRAIREGAMRMYGDAGYGPYRMDLEDGTPIGICGLFRRDELEDPDLGFALLPEFRGLGYAGEAARSVIGLARDELGIQRLLAIVSPENEPSVRLLGKLGFRFEKDHRMAGEDHDVALYGLDVRARPGSAPRPSHGTQ